ncbi:MAG: SPOR domain-containing protein [Candidatus Aminicenantes bacterium]|nr:SPOR domain-containing protein [Candidatus Aminicenantes bacterium]
MSKEFRELQVSTTALIFIILSILIMGMVIFFLGIQVGKKQSELMSNTLLLSQESEKTVVSPTPVVPAEEKITSEQSFSAASATPTEPASTSVSQTASARAEKSSAEIKPGESQGPASTTSGMNTTRSSAENKNQESVSPTSATAKPKTVSQTAKPKSSSGFFFVQVGAFTDRASAQLAAERFKKMGYNAVVKEPFPKDRQPMYRIWIGGFKTREEAQKTLNALNAASARRTGYFIVQQ